MFEIRVDDRELKALERQLRGFGGKVDTVMYRALNKTLTPARTRIARLLADRTGIGTTEIKKYMFLGKANRSNLRATIKLSAKRLSLSVLKPRRTRRGLSVKAGRKSVLVRRAFPALGGWFIRQEPGRKGGARSENHYKTDGHQIQISDVEPI